MLFRISQIRFASLEANTLSDHKVLARGLVTDTYVTPRGWKRKRTITLIKNRTLRFYIDFVLEQEMVRDR